MNRSALPFCSAESRTIRIIREAAESSKEAVVRQVRSPSVLMPPEGIRLPGRTSAGIGSPVMAERSTNPPPSSTSQSIGTRSPGLSRIVLPGATDSAGTFCWDPSGSRRTAVSGRMLVSASISRWLLATARASRAFPRRKKTVTASASRIPSKGSGLVAARPSEAATATVSSPSSSKARPEKRPVIPERKSG